MYVIIGKVTMFIALAVLRGLTLKILWDWFVTDQFNTISLSIAHALGLSLIANYLLLKSRDIEESNVSPFLISLVAAPFALLLGFVYKQFL